MEITFCPNCQLKVVAKGGKCPSCGLELTSHFANDASPKSIEPHTETNTPATLSTPVTAEDSKVVSPPVAICAVCHAEGSITTRAIYLSSAKLGLGSVQVERLPDVVTPMCSQCYHRGRRLQLHRILFPFVLILLMVGLPFGVMTVAAVQQDRQQAPYWFFGGSAVALLLLVGCFVLFSRYVRRALRNLIPNEALAMRLKRVLGVVEFGLLRGPTFGPTRRTEESVTVAEFLSIPLPTSEGEIKSAETTHPSTTLGFKLFWVAILVGMPALLLWATYFSDERIMERKYRNAIEQLLTRAQALSIDLPSLEDPSEERPLQSESPEVTLNNTMVFSVKSVTDPVHAQDNRLPNIDTIDSSRLGFRSRKVDVLDMYRWHSPSAQNEKWQHISYVDFQQALPQVERIQYVVLVHFVEWTDPISRGPQALIQPGSTTFDTYLFDVSDRSLLASHRHRVDQGLEQGGKVLVNGVIGAREKLVELVDTQLRQWLQSEQQAKESN